MSDYRYWDQLDHAEDWLLFPENLGSRLSIDETSLSDGELYTIITNKEAKGRKGALVAVIKGTKASAVTDVLFKIPLKDRLVVKEITLDMSNAMDWIVRQGFPHAKKISDRFHVQQLVSEALQEIRIRLRWEAIEEENNEIIEANKNKVKYSPIIYSNGDSKKQLLARSRYLLFKPQSKWSASQKERADILFKAFPELYTGYKLSLMFRNMYESSNKITAQERLEAWYKKVNSSKLKTFITASNTIKNNDSTILAYFPTRSTNASAESFNAKIKGFRGMVRGVKDRKFFLYRIAKLYA